MSKSSAMPGVTIQDQLDKDLPEEWVMACIKDIAEINPRHPKGLADSMPVSFVSMAALNEDSPTFARLEERPYGEVRKGFTHFQEGDVLFAKITPCMENGKGAVATGLRNGIGCGTTELHVLRPLDGIDALYLYRFLSQRSVRRDAAETFTSSAGQARVPTRFIEELEIPLPPLAEQKLIVEKVEELLTRVNAAREHLAKVPAILKRFRQSVLAAACSGELVGREQPCSYFERSLVEMGVDIQTGPFGSALHRSDYVEGGIPLINPMHIRDGKMLPDVRFSVPPAKAVEMSRYRLRAGDVVLGRRGEMGRAAVVRGSQEGFLCGTGSMVLRCNKTSLDAEFLCASLRSPRTVAALTEGSVGSTMINLNQSVVSGITVLGIPLPEQHEIVRRVEDLFFLADSIEKQVAAGMARVEKLTQAILTKAFCGELVPQGPKDEPGSILLDRVKRASNTLATKTRVRQSES